MRQKPSFIVSSSPWHLAMSSELCSPSCCTWAVGMTGPEREVDVSREGFRLWCFRALRARDFLAIRAAAVFLSTLLC